MLPSARVGLAIASALAVCSCVTQRQAQEVRDLRSQVSELQRNLVDVSMRVNNMDSRIEIVSQKVAELDARVQAGGSRQSLDVSKLPPPPAAEPAASVAVPPPAPQGAPVEKPVLRMDPISVYNGTFLKLQKGKLDEAEKGFREFIDLYPTHENADNAYYWLGEIYYSKGEFEPALRTFRELAEKYPKGNKVPDAMVKSGYCLLKLNRTEDAKVEFKKVIEEHPFSFAANQAQRKLEEL
ncbi:MAG: tol-pal system protein YbgF [Nitrospirae bacterium]|nr:tol-pal system protein YbgF [Nitrospirota bacterium]